MFYFLIKSKIIFLLVMLFYNLDSVLADSVDRIQGEEFLF